MERLKANKGTIIITTIVCLLPILIGILLWDKIPNEVATHFGSDGAPNGWSSKGFAVFGLPLFVTGCHLLCTGVTCADPKSQRLGGKMFKLILWICPLASLFCAVSVYGYALDMNISVDLIARIFVGLLFVVIGNYLPKCRQNYTVGIKLPWTLDDENNWNATHRFAGWVWMIGGVIFILGIFVDFETMWFSLGLILVLAFIPALYSFIYYVKHK